MIAIPGRISTGHGGNIHAVVREKGRGFDEIIDFSANINPIGPPEWLRPLLSRELEKVQHYPEPEYQLLLKQIANHHGVNTEKIRAANGSTELLYIIPRVLSIQRGIVVVPSYIDYIRALELAGITTHPVYLTKENNFQFHPELLQSQLKGNDLVILGSPNNPTGATVAAEDILNLARSHPKSFFLVDEAFLDFVEAGESVGGKLPNIMTLNSMTKFYGIPGLRLGYGIFPEEIAEIIGEHLPPWSINSMAQAFGIKALQDTEYQQHTIKSFRDLKKQLEEQLNHFPQLKIYPSSANYILIQLLGKITAPELAVKLIDHSIMIRSCDNYQGLNEYYFRVAVRTKAENDILVSALKKILQPASAKPVVKENSKTPALMFQGTSSNAGKSILTAAMCRILLKDGIRVAPFKAQNMSLNSFVTMNGEEMGRAQVVQAQAAKLDPDVRMNPVLLKPNSDTGSQIIVEGKPVGNMSVSSYDSYKPEAWKAVQRCYDSLAHDYQAIILEGAGSPGEVNLKKRDIVNMPMARYANSPVLLVGDIDRGGIYASFVGTMEVLEEWERKLIAGFVVNRFRGQASLLDSAHQYTLDHTGRAVLGVIPYLSDLGIPEEDSVSFKSGIFNTRAQRDDAIEIALINFPHISNFTDVEPFLGEPDVSLRVINSVKDLGSPDVILLPGSKNVIGDLQFLQDNGFVDAIKKFADTQCEIVGICGGYQILGKTVKDPLGIESSRKEVSALGLLDFSTELKADKQLIRRSGVHLSSGEPVYGYEIHHGISAHDLQPLLKFEDQMYCGTHSRTANVWGSYLHGIFDSDSFRRWFIDSIRKKKHLDPIQDIVAPYDLEQAFDRLADTVRENLDMDNVYRLLRL